MYVKYTLKWITLKELWTSVSSKSITIHFLCISWCLIAGNKYEDCKGSGLTGGVKLPSDLLFAPGILVFGPKLESVLLFDFPKQQNNVCHSPRPFFIWTLPIIIRNVVNSQNS